MTIQQTLCHKVCLHAQFDENKSLGQMSGVEMEILTQASEAQATKCPSLAQNSMSISFFQSPSYHALVNGCCQTRGGCGHMLRTHLAVGVSVRLQQVAALAQTHLQAHHQALTQRVNGRVGHLPAQRQHSREGMGTCTCAQAGRHCSMSVPRGPERPHSRVSMGMGQLTPESPRMCRLPARGRTG